MRVLVTGAAGFIGSHVCEALLRDGHDVVGLDCFVPYYARAAKEENLGEMKRRGSFEFRELDLRTDELDAAVQRADVVIHEAAMPGLVRSWTDIDLYATCNIVATQRLLEACVRARVPRYIHASTSSVYGRDAVGDETLPVRPISPYGVTKLAAEHLAAAYMQLHDLPVVILRYFSIYGPRQRPDMAYHIFIESMLDGRDITVFGDGTQSRSSTYIDDCVAGTLAAATGARAGETYNIGGGAEIGLNEVIDVLAAELGVTPRITHAPPRAGDQFRTVADTTKARNHFGYEARVSPAEGLARQARWHAERRGSTN